MSGGSAPGVKPGATRTSGDISSDQAVKVPGPIPTTRGPALLIVSPHAGQAQDEDALRRILRHEGIVVDRVLRVDELSRTERAGEQWAATGTGLVIAAGGDGTISAAVAQLASCRLPLGILPMGTMNDSARSLGIPLDLEAAAHVVATGVPTFVDAGLVEPVRCRDDGLAATTVARGSENCLPDAGSYFMQAVTLGLHADFAELATDVRLRERWGPLTYAVSTVRAMKEAQSLSVVLEMSDVSFPGRASRWTLHMDALQVTIANTPHIAGPANVEIPGAVPCDHKLDVVVIESPTAHPLSDLVAEAMESLEMLQSRWLGDHTSLYTPPADPESPSLPIVRHFQVRAVTVRAPGAAEVALDGEPCQYTPVRVCAVPDALRVVLPPHAREELLQAASDRSSA